MFTAELISVSAAPKNSGDLRILSTRVNGTDSSGVSLRYVFYLKQTSSLTRPNAVEISNLFALFLASVRYIWLSFHHTIHNAGERMLFLFFQRVERDSRGKIAPNPFSRDENSCEDFLGSGGRRFFLGLLDIWGSISLVC